MSKPQFTLRPRLEKKIYELNLAHGCGVLMYSRDKSLIAIAKKLRPEFSRFFLSSEVKDCMKMIEKFNKNVDNIGIDIVIVDSDVVGLKLIEFINSRAKSAEFVSLPIIATLALLPNSADNIIEMEAQFNSVGGVQRILQAPFTTMAIMDALLDIVYNTKTVDAAYREIRMSIAQQPSAGGAGYPFFPIFDGTVDSAKSPSGPHISQPSESSDESEDEDPKFEDESIGSLAISEVTEGTQALSLLSPSIRGARQAFIAGNTSVEEFEEDDDSCTVEHLDKQQRLAADKALLKMVETGPNAVPSMNIKPRNIAAEAANILAKIQPITIPSPSRRPTEHQTTPTAGGNLGSRRQSMHPSGLSAITSPTNNASIPQNMTTRAALMLSPEHRVKPSQHPYSGTKPPLGIEADNTRSQLQSQSRRSSSLSNPYKSIAGKLHSSDVGDHDVNTDIEPFIHHLPPNISTPMTVSGLPKKFTQKHWRTISANRNVNDAANFRKLSALSELAKGVPTHGSRPSTGNSERPPSSNNHDRDTSPPRVASEDTNNSIILTPLKRVPSLSGNSISSPPYSLVKTRSQRMPNILAHVSHENATNTEEHDVSKTMMLLAHRAAHTVGQVTAKASERALMDLVDQHPGDVQLTVLREINIVHRKMNPAERELLEHALRVEKEGEHDFVEVALGLYKRASSKAHNRNSPDRHLPKLFMAAFYFRQKDFVLAFKEYDKAVVLLEGRPNEALSTHDNDCFVAFFNRAMTFLRLGNDAMALQDLTQALYFEPNDVQALNVYSIVLRRSGKYLQAIEVQNTTRRLKKEQDLLKEVAAIQREERRKLPTSRSNSPTGGSLSRSGSPKDRNPHLRGSEISSLLAAANREDDVVDTTHGIPVIVPAPKGASFGLRDRIQLALMKAKRPENPNGNDEGLNAFKMHNGFADTLFHELFFRTTALQDALIVTPGDRSRKDLDTIAGFLRLVPAFRRLADATIFELAGQVEYRLVSSSMDVFTQNTPCDAVVVLVRGKVTVAMDGPTLALKNLTVGELQSGEVFGHIDLLMQQEDSALVQQLKLYIMEDSPDHGSANLVTPLTSAAGGVRGLGGELSPSFRDRGRMPTTISAATGAHQNSHSLTDDNNAIVRAMGAKLVDEIRALQPTAFGNYHLTGMSEILLIPPDMFRARLMGWAEDELRDRFDVIKASGVFATWQKHDVVRLARMSQVRSYKSGEVILRQKEKPEFLCIIMKGMCKVLKRPNQSEVLERKLVDLKAKAARHDFKYLYHHGLRNVVSKGDVRPILNGETIPGSLGNANAAAGSFTNTSFDNASQSGMLHRSLSSTFMNFQANVNVLSLTNVTLSEEMRCQLELEIRLLEAEIARVTSQETRLFSSETNGANERPVSLLEDKTYCDITTLQWPMLFGEACVLQPEDGVSRGAIVADTACEVLLIHKTQLCTFKVSSAMLDRLKIRSVNYPDDQILLNRLTQTDGWKLYRENVMKAIPKGRWPKQASQLDAFVV